MSKFSIITPVYNHNEKRARDSVRSAESVRSQTFGDAEHILVDQTDIEHLRLMDVKEDPRVKIIRQPHVERLFALRAGFVNASGEWFCVLDSDDIYLPHYLETVNQMIEENPDVKMFNFGSIHIYKDGRVTVRDEFKPKKLDIGHEIFGGGNIVNGTFVFHRSVWDDLGDFPQIDNLWNPWDFSIAAQEEFPELKQFFMVDHEGEPEKIAKELGNPWGQDFYLFYKYTRKYHSMPVNKHLYAVYHK